MSGRATNTRARGLIRDAHTTRTTASSSTMTSNQQASVDAANDAADALPGLLNDILITHVFPHLPDPADLAILRGVSRGMRDAVDATGREIDEFSEEDAAERGYVRTLECLRRRGVLDDERLLCAAAAKSGDLGKLKALRAEELPWDELTCAYAAAGGHLETLKWARENDCPWDEWTCASAAKGGHLEVLKWARANGCPWNELTCANAAFRGRLEVLKWARANGCPWDEYTSRLAAARGYVET